MEPFLDSDRENKASCSDKPKDQASSASATISIERCFWFCLML